MQCTGEEYVPSRSGGGRHAREVLRMNSHLIVAVGYGVGVARHTRMNHHLRRSQVQYHRLQPEPVRGNIELHIELVWQRSVFGVVQASINIGKRAAVSFFRGVEANVGSKVIQVSFQGRLLIVVVNLSIGQPQVSDPEIEYVRRTLTLTRRRLRKVVLPCTVGLQMHHGMLDYKLPESYLPMQHRLNLQTDRQLVDLKQRWLVRFLGPMHGDVVEMCGQCRKTEIKPPNLGSSPRGSVCLFGDLAQSIVLEMAGLQEQQAPNERDQNQCRNSRQQPTDDGLPLHGFS